MVVAGEISGDMHAAKFIHELRKRKENHSFRFFGIGGAEMEAQGVEILMPMEQLSVMGLVEVLRHFPRIYRVLRKMRQVLRQQKPDLLITVDYPGFNLALAKTAKQLGIPVLHFVSPQIWAWRENRIHKIAKRVDHMAVLFPFEVSYYERVGVPVTYVGHTLVGELDEAFALTQHVAQTQLKSQLDLDSLENPDAVLHQNFLQNRKTVGLFPGSRVSEVSMLLPVLLETAQRLYQQNPDVQFLLSRVLVLDDELFNPAKEFLAEYPDFPLYIVNSDTETARVAIRACDAVIAASGTLILEIALLETPMVVIYKASPLTYKIFQWVIKIPHVSLVNIVAQREVVPELLQNEATAEKITQAVLPLLDENAEARQTMIAGLQEVKAKLGEGKTASKMADLVEEIVV